MLRSNPSAAKSKDEVGWSSPARLLPSHFVLGSMRKTSGGLGDSVPQLTTLSLGLFYSFQ